MSNLDRIITRQYSNFMGVDFSGGEVPYYHSPDAKNMWRDYNVKYIIFCVTRRIVLDWWTVMQKYAYNTEKNVYKTVLKFVCILFIFKGEVLC